MDKSEFLQALRLKLYGLPESEIQRTLDYFSELLDDRIEDGMTEREAVASLEPVDQIARQILDASDGLAKKGGGQVPPPDETGNPRGGQWVEYIADGVEDVDIKLLDGAILGEPSPDGRVHVHYYTGNMGEYRVWQQGGSLYMDQQVNGRGSVLRFGLGMLFYGRAEPVRVQLPAQGLRGIRCKTASGRIELTGLCLAGNAVLKPVDGRIQLTDLQVQGVLEAATQNGRVELHGVQAGEARLSTSNGRLELGELKARAVKGTTMNGRIELYGLDAEETKLKSMNGPVSGTLAGEPEEYTFDTHTMNGSIKVDFQ